MPLPVFFTVWFALVSIVAQAGSKFEQYFQRGLHALGRNEYEAAEAAFRQAAKLQPQNSLVYFHLGQIHLQRRQFGEALTYFRQAIARDGREAQFYVHLAVLYTQLQRFHDAQETLAELLRVRPDYAEAELLMGRVAQEQGDHLTAERHLRQYLKAQPDVPEGLWRLGVTLLAQEKHGEAELLFLQAVEKAPDLGPAHYNLGVLYSRRGEQEKARSHLQRATLLLPDNGQVHYHLGAILSRLDELGQAEEALRRALSLSPDLAEAHYALGTLLRRAGRAQEAARALAEYERLSQALLDERQRSRRVTAYHLDVKRLLEQDRLPEAQAHLQEILQVDVRNDLAYYRLGQIYYLRRDDELALEMVNKALSLKDFEAGYYLLQGMCLERLQREEEAGAAYRRVVGLADYAGAHLALGRRALGRGEAREAVEHLKKAVGQEPENVELRLLLARALEQAGDHEESRRQQARAKELRQKQPPH